MTDFVISDTHFGHSTIIKLCNRPFADAAHMNAELIRRWNSVVGDKDTVYHLGDFGWDGSTHILPHLNGSKILIPGNHDSKEIRKDAGWALVHPKNQIVRLNGVLLFHYPIEDWEGRYKGRIHLHGHTHGTAKKIKGRLEVSVECINYAPITLEEAIKRAQENDAILPA